MTAQTKIACYALLLLAGCASSPRVTVPDVLRPASSEALAMIVAAKSVQIFFINR